MQKPTDKRLYTVLAAAFLGWMFDGLEMGNFPLIARPALQQMQASQGLVATDAFVGFALIAVIGTSFNVTVDSWRWVALVGAVPALATFLIRLFVPESERWEHAKKTSNAQPLREVLRPPLLRWTGMATLLASIALIGTWGSVQWLPLWADQMTAGTNPGAKAFTQTISAIGSVFGCLLGAWRGGRFGRRPAYFILCLTSRISCALLFRGVDTYGTPFPTLTFIVGAVITLIYAFGLLIIWFCPETRGKPLPE